MTEIHRGPDVIEVRGDVVEVYPATSDEEAIRVEFFGDEVDRITQFDPLTGSAINAPDRFTFFPAKALRLLSKA